MDDRLNVPARPLILIGILLLVLAIPLSHGGWGEELPWIRLIAAAAGPATIYYLYWFYWRDTTSQDESRRRTRQLVLVGSPAAGVVGVLLAGATGAENIAAAVVVGLAIGCVFYFFTA